MKEETGTIESPKEEIGLFSRIWRLVKSSKTVIGLAIVALLAQLGWMALNFSALPVWMQYKLDMGASLGWVMGAFMLTEALFRPPLGALGDRIGRRPLMLIGPAISVFTSIATIFVHGPLTVPIMIVLRAIDGIGLAAFWPAAFAAFGDAVEEKYRSTAMAILNGTQMGAVALGMLLAGVANDYLSQVLPAYTGAFYFCSLVFLLTVVVGFMLLPKQIGDHHHHVPEVEETHIPHTNEIEGALKLVPDMIVLSVVMFAAIGILMPIVKLYAMDALGLNETQFGSIVFPVAIILGVLALPFGWFADKWGKMVSVCYGMLVCATAMWIIAMFRSIVALAGASIILGIGFQIAFPAWMAVVSQAAPKDRRGQVMGAVGLAQGMGALLGVLVAPIIYTRDWLSLPRLGINHITIPFYLCAILLSISTLMTFIWISKKRAEQAGGRQISGFERRGVVALSIIGAVAIAGWVVYRLTAPIPPGNVAWIWVQQSARHKIEKAEQYALPSNETEDAARVYGNWINSEKASYRITSTRVDEGGRRATVIVEFKFPDSHPHVVQEVIILRHVSEKDWKVIGRSSK